MQSSFGLTFTWCTSVNSGSRKFTQILSPVMLKNNSILSLYNAQINSVHPLMFRYVFRHHLQSSKMMISVIFRCWVFYTSCNIQKSSDLCPLDHTDIKRFTPTVTVLIWRMYVVNVDKNGKKKKEQLVSIIVTRQRYHKYCAMSLYPMFPLLLIYNYGLRMQTISTECERRFITQETRRLLLIYLERWLIFDLWIRPQKFSPSYYTQNSCYVLFLRDVKFSLACITNHTVDCSGVQYLRLSEQTRSLYARYRDVCGVNDSSEQDHQRLSVQHGQWLIQAAAVNRLLPNSLFCRSVSFLFSGLNN